MTQETGKPVSGPLSGIRVLDLTQYLAGPFCTRLLRDMGAEVIKVEAPPLGDIVRYTPFQKNGLSGYFTQHNVGKKSVVLNLKKEEGREAFKKLAAEADVCVENLKPGTMKRLGLDYDELVTHNPRLIMCSISGFGQTGPWAEKPGMAGAVHAMSGLMWSTGRLKDPNGPPIAPGAAFGDTAASLHAFGGICAALYRREQTGEGEYIDIALLDSLFGMMDSTVMMQTWSEGTADPVNMTFLTPTIKGPNGYATVALSGSDREWKGICLAIERPDLIDNDRFNNLAKRAGQFKLILETISEWASSRDDIEEAVEILAGQGIIATRVLSVAEAAAHPQIKARNMLVEIDHPRGGKVPVVNSPFRFKNARAGIKGSIPELGEHTEEIFSRIGVSTDSRPMK